MQKEIKLTDKTLLVVSVPNEASDLTLPKVGISDLYFHTDDKEYEDGYISVGIPQGYELLGIYPELTEEQCAMVVEENNTNAITYRDYSEITDFCYETALESFQSLMEREQCYTVNPYLEFECPNQWCENGYIDQGYGDKWRCNFCQDNEDKEEEAQQRTFSKYAILIKSK